MIAYGKMASQAIGVMSYLATLPPAERAGSACLAAERDLSQALAAKLLSTLASAGLLDGQPGPGGGYRLAKPASEITLLAIVSLFEKPDDTSRCPFGPHWCGTQDPCPLHNDLVELGRRNREFLEKTHLSVFQQRTPSRSFKTTTSQ